MEYRILGPLEVLDGTRPVVLPRGRGRALLAVLVLRAGQVVASDRLIDVLWGESPPPTAAAALHNLVSALRGRLEPARPRGQAPEVLVTCPSGYLLAIERDQVDAQRFRRLVEQTAGTAPPQRAAGLRAALALWRGPALADLMYEPFAQSAIAELEELRVLALEQRIEADLALGRHAELVAELERLCSEHPMREGLRGHLMVALYRCGRQADALEVYRNARRDLLDALGVEPGPALRRLERAVLAQDPVLDLPATARAQTIPAPEPWLRAGRKLVTVVFVDLSVVVIPVGSGDPEPERATVHRGYDIVTRATARHGGSVEGLIGDVAVAVFGVPTAHEDDALRAVRAATDVLRDLAQLNAELRAQGAPPLAARAGLNTGEVVVGDPGTLSGSTVSWAAELQQAAAEGEALVSDGTRRLIEDFAVLQPAPALRDRTGREQLAWRLVHLAPRASVATGRTTRFVGRRPELRVLRAAFAEVLRSRRARQVTVYGDAGLGKSRLARELAADLGAAARVLTGHCPSYGEGLTFWPLREIILQATGDNVRRRLLDVLAGQAHAEAIAARVSAAIGIGEAGGEAVELFPAVRNVVEALAGPRPLIVVLEDVHWAQPTLLDLVDYLTAATAAPVLLLCLARPELLERRPDWAADAPGRRHLELQPLAAEESARLVADRLGHRRLPPDAAKRVIATAQGNPLFLEQLVAAMREREELDLPPSLLALLAARLDRLGPAERDVLRCASVIGQEFSAGAVGALVPEAGRPFLSRHLAALKDKELIEPSGRIFVGDDGLAFRHVLIQLAALRSITRTARAELHERVAAWLDEAAQGDFTALAEVSGYHCEQACLDRRAVGLLDAHTDAVALRAGEKLARAGLRAYERYDMAAAANLLSRARALLPVGHVLRPTLLRPLAAAQQQAGRLDVADDVLRELLDEVHATGDHRAARAIRLERTRIRLFSGPDPTPLAVIRDEAQGALERGDASPDELAQACHVLALVHLRAGRIGEMERIARTGVAHADRSGNPRDELAARWNVAWALQAGVTPVADAIAECAALTRWRGREHPGVLCELGSLYAMRGEVDRARDLVRRGRQLMQEWMQVRSPLVFAARPIAAVDVLAGDAPSAAGHLRSALDVALEMGLREQTTELAARLSRIRSQQNSWREARRLAILSEERAPSESVTAQALWRASKAHVLAHHDPENAQHLAREAAALPPMEMLNLRAELLVDLAVVLFATGQSAGARRAAASAARLYERKGNAVASAHARRLATHD